MSLSRKITATSTLSLLAGLAAFVGTHDAAAAEGAETVRLDSRVQVWVSGDDRGPNRIGKNTGAGIMDANFTFDRTAAARAAFGREVTLGTVFTRSANTPNGDNSYMQGGFAFGKITETGISLGAPVDLPVLEGERAFMRPLIAFTPKYAVIIAASEDNESANGNPKPVLYLADKATGQLVEIANNPRPREKPIDLIRVAERANIRLQGANNQRGPHMIVPVNDNSFLVGTQYNNQAQEVFRVTVDDGARVTVDWLQRYSDNAVHNRPQVVYTPGAAEGFMAAVECNAQPANIGLRLTKFDVATGRQIASKIVVRADPQKNKYVAEPHIVDLGDKVGMVYALSAKARERNGGNGHAGGANVSQVALFAKADLAQVGETMMAPANYQRHPGAFAMKYGADETPAIGVISGSSTGTSKGLLQVIPIRAEGTLGVKDPLKSYTVAPYSDVANLQARGKRNPNNQAKGFINGIGDVPNPGFDKPGGFYPEVRSFSFAAVTGFSGPEAAAKGLKESLWLSLVPATWKKGLATTPGDASPNAGDGPAPRVHGPATDEAADHASSLSGVRRGLGDEAEASSCAVRGPGRAEGAGGLVLAGLALVALRRRRTRSAEEA